MVHMLWSDEGVPKHPTMFGLPVYDVLVLVLTSHVPPAHTKPFLAWRTECQGTVFTVRGSNL